MASGYELQVRNAHKGASLKRPRFPNIARRDREAREVARYHPPRALPLKVNRKR